MGGGGEWADRVRELEAENARLRSVQTEMLGIVRGYADGCSYAVQNGSAQAAAAEAAAWEILKELEEAVGSGVPPGAPDGGVKVEVLPFNPPVVVFRGELPGRASA